MATDLNLPINDELVETWEAAGEYSAECMAAMWAASIKGNVDENRHNPLQLDNFGSFRGLASYETWAEAVVDWCDRAEYESFEFPRSVQIRHLDLDTLSPRQKLTHEVIMRDVDPLRGSEPERFEPTPGELAFWWGNAYPTMAPFNPLDPVCEQWLAWAAQHDAFPALTCISLRVDNGDYLYHFHNGLRIGLHNDEAYIVRLKG